MHYTTEQRLSIAGLAILSLVSLLLTFKFCYDVGLGAGWPIIWGVVGIGFELIKCAAVKNTLNHFYSDFYKGAIAALLAGGLMLFSGAASFNVLSAGLAGHESNSGARNLLEQQITDLKTSIANAKERAEVFTERSMATKAKMVVDTEIKPAQEKLYSLQAKLNKFHADFLGDNASSIALGVSAGIEILAFYCAFAIPAKIEPVAKYNPDNQKYAKYNNNIENIIEYSTTNSVIDQNIYSEIKTDIEAGYTRPTHAELRHYKLNQEEIRAYLAELAREGVIFPTGEKSIRYHLS